MKLELHDSQQSCQQVLITLTSIESLNPESDKFPLNGTVTSFKINFRCGNFKKGGKKKSGNLPSMSPTLSEVLPPPSVGDNDACAFGTK